MYIPLTFEGSQAKCLYASGGYEGYFISGSDEYKYHTFITGSSIFEVQAGTLDNVTIFMVGGGGGGGFSPTAVGQGGGGGEVKILTNQRLFGGKYNITIAEGGIGVSSSIAEKGFDGGLTTFSGSNLNVSSSGGQGGSWYNSPLGTLGRSGNGYAGGVSVLVHGGGGGGATNSGSRGDRLSPYTGDGGEGYTFVTANINLNTTVNYGCGGGGGASPTSRTAGDSCLVYYGQGQNSTADTPSNYINAAPALGGGGGGGAATRISGDGGCGTVYIQYKINSYCKNYFNKPGSCGCVQRKFEYDYQSGFWGDQSMSCMYVPCGTSTMVSESIDGYYPKTLCLQSGTFYYGPVYAANTSWAYGFASGGVQCSTGSICGGIPQYQSSCSSSFYTYVNNETGTEPVWYVARNQVTLSVDTLPISIWPTYKCQSTILSNISGSLPYANITRYNNANTFNSNWAINNNVFGTTSTLYWYDISGILQSHSVSYPNTESYNFIASFAIANPSVSGTGPQGTLTLGSTYGIYSGSGLPTCGCP